MTQYLPESQPDPIPEWMVENVMTEQQQINRDFDAHGKQSRGRWIAVGGLFMAIVLAFCVKEVYAVTIVTRQGGSSDFACCEDANCDKPIAPQYARDWAAKDACAALTEADGKTRYFRQWPMRIDKAGAPTPIPPTPPTTAVVSSTTLVGPYTALEGKVVSGAISVRLSGNCTGTIDVTPAGPWVFSVDGKAVNTESFCPYGMPDDATLYDTTTLTNGSHTVTAVSGALTVTATFTVNNPLGVSALSATQAPNPTNPANTNVTLTWSSVVGATSYQLERCTGATCTNFVALAGATASPYANTNLPGGLTFNYRVKASDGSRTSVSNVVAVATPVVGTGTAKLDWLQDGLNTDGSPATLAGFRVLYGQSASALTSTIDVANPAATTYTVDKLGSGAWYFAIRAYAVNGAESNSSNVAMKVVP